MVWHKSRRTTTKHRLQQQQQFRSTFVRVVLGQCQGIIRFIIIVIIRWQEKKQIKLNEKPKIQPKEHINHLREKENGAKWMKELEKIKEKRILCETNRFEIVV